MRKGSGWICCSIFRSKVRGNPFGKFGQHVEM
jgi:hypothetical protein